jgi:lysophospholipase L1-like esterase
MKNKFIYLAIIAAGFASCEPEFENTVDANYTAGDADFTTYVAVGNSLTAGYMDGTVSRVGQTYSYPNLLAQQFALVGGGAFTQPSYAEDVNNLGGIQGLAGTRLVINAAVGGVQPIAGTPTITLTPQATAYNNMGVPGAKSFHLLAPGYGNIAGVALGQANPYFVRHATSPTATVLGDAMSKVPTFFTNWIGANDVLAYATGGGALPDNPATPTVDESLLPTPAADHNSTGNMNPATYGGNDITNSDFFASVYSTIVTTLTSGGAKGVVATVPSVTSIPYFTSVPFNPLTAQSIGKGLAPAGSDTATQIAYGTAAINQANAQLYGPLDGVFSAYGEPNRVNLLSTTSANPILIYDADATDRSAEIRGALSGTLGVPTATAFGMVFGKARQATAADLVVLPASSVIGTANASSPSPLININGVSYPMANKWVLTANEKAKVANATAAYNAAIVSIANANDIAVADMNAIMNQLITGLRIETGQLYTANYFSGSATEGVVLFSLDGVHPNARGYAVIANEVIKVINEFYNANLPLHNPSYFPGINIVPSN